VLAPFQIEWLQLRSLRWRPLLLIVIALAAGAAISRVFPLAPRAVWPFSFWAIALGTVAFGFAVCGLRCLFGGSALLRTYEVTFLRLAALSPAMCTLAFLLRVLREGFGVAAGLAGFVWLMLRLPVSVTVSCGAAMLALTALERSAARIAASFEGQARIPAAILSIVAAVASLAGAFLLLPFQQPAWLALLAVAAVFILFAFAAITMPVAMEALAKSRAPAWAGRKRALGARLPEVPALFGFAWLVTALRVRNPLWLCGVAVACAAAAAVGWFARNYDLTAVASTWLIVIVCWAGLLPSSAAAAMTFPLWRLGVCRLGWAIGSTVAATGVAYFLIVLVGIGIGAGARGGASFAAVWVLWTCTSIVNALLARFVTTWYLRRSGKPFEIVDILEGCAAGAAGIAPIGVLAFGAPAGVGFAVSIVLCACFVWLARAVVVRTGFASTP
jgi:hypothetical protein